MSETDCKNEGTQFELKTDEVLHWVSTHSDNGMAAHLQYDIDNEQCTLSVQVTFMHKREAVAFLLTCLAALTA